MKLQHDPKHPARAHIFGEVIYLEHWRRLMATEPDWHVDSDEPMLESVLDLPDGTGSQEDASAAASFATYLGCNCGRALVETIAKYRPQFLDDTGLFVYAKENYRHAWLNHNRRLCQSILGTDAPTVGELEVLERFARWLGTPDGMMFTSRAEKEIRETYTEVQRERDMKLRAQNRAKDIVAAEAQP